MYAQMRRRWRAAESRTIAKKFRCLDGKFVSRDSCGFICSRLCNLCQTFLALHGCTITRRMAAPLPKATKKECVRKDSDCTVTPPCVASMGTGSITHPIAPGSGSTLIEITEPSGDRFPKEGS